MARRWRCNSGWWRSAAKIFKDIAKENINVDMIVQNVSRTGSTDISFTVPGGDRLSTCRELRLTPAGSEANVAGLLAQADGSLLQASALPYTDEEMETPEYTIDLPESTASVLCLSHKTLGVGSTRTKNAILVPVSH